MPTYQVNGESLIMAWLADEPEATGRQAMLDWLPKLAANPVGVAAAVRPGRGAPAYMVRVPGTYAFVSYTVVEQYRTVLIIDIATSPFRR